MRGYARKQEANELTKIMNHCRQDTPRWFIEGLLFGIECCRYEYDPANEGQPWNEEYFIDDRYPSSMWGGIKEAWLYLYIFDIMTIKPCLSQFEQATMALDYYRNGVAGQVKSGCVIRSRGAIEFDRRWLQTTAKELAVFVKGRPIVLVGSTESWSALVNVELYNASLIDPDHYKNINRMVLIDQSAYDLAIATHTLPSHIQG